LLAMRPDDFRGILAGFAFVALAIIAFPIVARP